SGARLVATCHGRSEDLPGRQSLRSRMLAALQWAVLRRVHDHVVAVSDELAGHLPLPAGRIEVICNGIDPEAIRSAALLIPAPLPGNRPVKIGFVGRLAPVKQVDRLIGAMQILEQEAPGRFVLYLLGDGPLRSELERLVAELGLGDTVILLGFQADALPLIASLDAVAFSSRHEGLPMAALEALALGTLVVGPPVGGLEDLLSRSPLGVLSASDTPEALAKALHQATSPAFDSLRGRAAIPAKYLLSNCAQKYRRLYGSLVSSNHSSSEIRSVT
ncbi:MAG: glycosyltransferase, partial [Wenzhouxiangella sp.]